MINFNSSDKSSFNDAVAHFHQALEVKKSSWFPWVDHDCLLELQSVKKQLEAIRLTADYLDIENTCTQLSSDLKEKYTVLFEGPKWFVWIRSFLSNWMNDNKGTSWELAKKESEALCKSVQEIRAGAIEKKWEALCLGVAKKDEGIEEVKAEITENLGELQALKSLIKKFLSMKGEELSLKDLPLLEKAVNSLETDDRIQLTPVLVRQIAKQLPYLQFKGVDLNKDIPFASFFFFCLERVPASQADFLIQDNRDDLLVELTQYLVPIMAKYPRFANRQQLQNYIRNPRLKEHFEGAVQAFKRAQLKVEEIKASSFDKENQVVAFMQEYSKPIELSEDLSVVEKMQQLQIEPVYRALYAEVLDCLPNQVIKEMQYASFVRGICGDSEYLLEDYDNPIYPVFYVLPKISEGTEKTSLLLACIQDALKRGSPFSQIAELLSYLPKDLAQMREILKNNSKMSAFLLHP